MAWDLRVKLLKPTSHHIEPCKEASVWFATRFTSANFQLTDTCVQASAFNGKNNHAEAAHFNYQLSRDTREAEVSLKSLGVQSQMAIWPRGGRAGSEISRWLQ